MITVQTAHEMNLHKHALRNRRDELFDDYLDCLDKIKVWEINGEKMMTCKLTKNRNHAHEIVLLLKEQLRKTSMHLRILDEELTGIRQRPDPFYSLLEIN